MFLNRSMVLTVVLAHFDYLDYAVQEKVVKRFRGAPIPKARSKVSLIDLDWVLCTFLSTWILADNAMLFRLREGFREIVNRRPNADARVDTTDAKLNLGEFVQAMAYLDDSADRSDAAQTAYVALFKDIAASRHRPTKSKPHPDSSKRNSVILQSNPTEGIGEQDFVRQVGQFFRLRRPKKGIRTNGTPLVDLSNGMFIGGKGLAHVQGMEMETKPGLRRSTAVSILPVTSADRQAT